MSRRDSRAALGAFYCPTCEQEYPGGELCPRDGTRLVRLASEVDPLVGRSLDDRFTIEEKLGAGGMGSVYRARQHSVGRDVAIKVVNPGLVADPLATKRFLREAKLASRLSHPNIVSVLDFGQTRDGLFYLVMELVHGRTLHAAVLEAGRFPLDRVVRIAGQLCDALEGAHALPIMHRDLKPANIMLLAAGRDLVKVLDFGLAKSLAVDATSTTMTSAGALLGTPTFMPPEVANGDPYDERADLYSLGCILYMLCSGRPPFVTDSVPEMIALHGTAIPQLVANVPYPVAQVIERLLRKDPNARYPTAAAVRAALEQAVDTARASGLREDAGEAPPLPAVATSLAGAPRPASPVSMPATRPSDELLTRPMASVQPGESSRLPDGAPASTLTTHRASGARIAAIALGLVVIGAVAWLATHREAAAPPRDAGVAAPAAPIITPLPAAAAPLDAGAGIAAPPDAPPPPLSPDAAVAHHAPSRPGARTVPPPAAPPPWTPPAPIDAGGAPDAPF